MIDDILLEAEDKMDKAVEAARHEFTNIRTGRATSSMFEQLLVDYYGAPTPMQQLASFQIPEARTVLISPFDRTATQEIIRTLRESDLGVNPTDDGNVVRVVLPALTEERRKEYVKQAKSKAEDGRVSVRGVRRKAKDQLDRLKKDGEGSEDDVDRAEKNLDSMTKAHTEQIDKMLEGKRTADDLMASTDSSLLARIFSPGPTRDNHPAGGATGKAGRNLPQAITTAVVLIVAVAVPLFTSLPAFVGVIGFVCLVGIWELAGAFARMGITLTVTPLYVGAIGMITCAWWLGSEGTLFALYITVFVCAAWRLLDRRQESRMSDVVSSTFTAVYVPFLASFVVLMLAAWRDPWVFVVFELMVIANDTGGWAAGVLFGKHPMAPALSPKKSWEGFAGSAATAIGVGCVGLWLLGAAWWWGIVAGVSIAFVGTMGDLTESLIKRESGLKDMSHILPGHGGVLDRVDALLMSAPVAYFIFAWALPGISWESSH